MKVISEHERRLVRRFLDGIGAIRAIRLWGIDDPRRLAERTPTFALTIDGLSPRAAAQVLAGQGIFAWDGDFYARALIERLGLSQTGGVLRIGAVHYNTHDEIERVLEALEAVARRPADVGRRLD